jgi:hypothetical protein
LRAAETQLPPAPGDDAVVTARNAFVGNDINRLNVAAAAVEPTHPLRVPRRCHGGCVCSSMIPVMIPGPTPVLMRTPAYGVFLDRFAGTLAADGFAGTGYFRLRGAVSGPNLNSSFSVCRHADLMTFSPGCADARHRAMTGDPIALAAAREALPWAVNWVKPVRPLLEQLAGQGVLSQVDIWRRLLAAVDGGALIAVRKFAALLPHVRRGRGLNAALDRATIRSIGRAQREFSELVVIALARRPQ